MVPLWIPHCKKVSGEIANIFTVPLFWLDNTFKTYLKSKPDRMKET
jgi:hypothetical protein